MSQKTAKLARKVAAKLGNVSARALKGGGAGLSSKELASAYRKMRAVLVGLNYGGEKK